MMRPAIHGCKGSIVVVVIAYYVKQNECCFQYIQLYLNNEVKII